MGSNPTINGTVFDEISRYANSAGEKDVVQMVKELEELITKSGVGIDYSRTRY